MRPLENGRPIRGLCYEAYEPMARDMLVTIGEEVVQSFGLVGLCVEHSTGLVLVGECSFRLQIAGLHRQESLAAMGEFIDRLKFAMCRSGRRRWSRTAAEKLLPCLARVARPSPEAQGRATRATRATFFLSPFSLFSLDPEPIRRYTIGR